MDAYSGADRLEARDNIREGCVGKDVDVASFVFDGLDKIPPDGLVHNGIDERSDVSREAHGYSTGTRTTISFTVSRRFLANFDVAASTVPRARHEEK